MSLILTFVLYAFNINPAVFDSFQVAVQKSDTTNCLRLAEKLVTSAKDTERQRVMSLLVTSAMARNNYGMADTLVRYFRWRFKDRDLLSNTMYAIKMHNGQTEDALYELLTTRSKRTLPPHFVVREISRLDMTLSRERVDSIIAKWQRDHPGVKFGYILLAQRAYMAGDTKKALKIVKEHGLHSLMLASTALQNGDYQLAIHLAEGEKEDTARAYYIIGRAYLALGDTAKGIDFLRRAVKAHSTDARREIIRLAISTGRSDIISGLSLSNTERLPVWFCQNSCDSIINLKSRRIKAEPYMFYKAMCLIEKDSTRSKGFELMDRLMETAPSSNYIQQALRIRSYAMLSDSATFKKLFVVEKLAICMRYGEAVDTLDELLKSANMDSTIRWNLMVRKGELLHKMGQDSLAIQVLMEVKFPYRPMALWHAFKIAMENGELELAQKFYDELITKYPRSPFTQMAIGLM